MTNEEMVVVKRALDLRKRGLIGVLWAEQGQYWISASEIDPHGTRMRVSLERLREIVESFDEKIPTKVVRNEAKCPTCQTNKMSA